MKCLVAGILLLTFSFSPGALAESGAGDSGVFAGAGDGRFTVRATESGSSGGRPSSGSERAGSSGLPGSSGSRSDRGGSSMGQGGSGNLLNQTASSTGEGRGGALAPGCIQFGACETCELPTLSEECRGGLGELEATGDGPAEATAPTPEEVRRWAISAAASVQLPAPAIGVAPDPSANAWRIVAVGQPLWLVDSAAATVSSSASSQGITVSITARRTAVEFDMGEATIRCTSMTRRPATADPRAKSPDCGYVYQRKGDRTVTATASWLISWSAAGQSGTVSMTRSSSRQLPVRELIAVNVRPA